MTHKPTLGYATRTDAVVALRGLGLDTQQIADKCGISPSTVTALEYSAARSKARAKLPSEQQGRAVVFPVDVLSSLRRPALLRGVTPNELARRIVEAVVDDGLIDAVLDDREEIVR